MRTKNNLPNMEDWMSRAARRDKWSEAERRGRPLPPGTPGELPPRLVSGRVGQGYSTEPVVSPVDTMRAGGGYATQSAQGQRGVGTNSYDPNTDYSRLIEQEAAKGVNADRALLAQYEAARNAKIAGEGLSYGQTNLYTQQMGQPPHYYAATDQSGYINDIYESAQAAQLAALEAAYYENMLSYDQAAAQIPGLYYQAKNATGADAETVRAGVNESIAASGLNTGAGSQVRLAQSNVLQGNLSALEREKASRLADLEMQRQTAQRQYQSAVAEAIASNKISQAQALYNEAVRVDASYREATEEMLAQLSAEGMRSYGEEPGGELQYNKGTDIFSWRGTKYKGFDTLRQAIYEANLPAEERRATVESLRELGFNLVFGDNTEEYYDPRNSPDGRIIAGIPASVWEELNSCATMIDRVNAIHTLAKDKTLNAHQAEALLSFYGLN